MDEMGYLFDENKKRHSVTELYASQRECFKDRVGIKGNEELWEDRVESFRLSTDHRIVSKEKAILSAYRDRITVNSETIPFDHVLSIDIVQRNRLIIHVKDSDVRYEFTGSVTFNAVKYRILFETVSAGKE